MPWTILIVSAVMEAVWATALGESDGFTRPGSTVVFLVAMVLSIWGLGWAVKHIPIGSAYAVWTGLGAALTVGYAMATGAEAVSAAKLIFVSGIIVAVVGLKMLPSGADRPDAEPLPLVLEQAGR
ncbi:multidrug efflux SMR transporter [Mycobacterium sp. SMC-8]|uniref:DMT family transporter n=1 Tax=Mycobacterium sp. SMC-8 TaxID=2857060 RepID=UPI0021B32890|nr:multidrug efflux SMR transporter [Mycobacterium sp. SMC-8]UXA14388.1 multidrug efflux SMR transporter [Mycobacterium sp. SMC-8]